MRTKTSAYSPTLLAETKRAGLFDSLRRVLKKGARVHYIVGNSTVEFDVSAAWPGRD